MRHSTAALLITVLTIGLFACGVKEPLAENRTFSGQEKQSEGLSPEPQAGSSNVVSVVTTAQVQEKTEASATSPNRETESSSDSSSGALSLLSTPLVAVNDYWGVQPFSTRENKLGIQFHNGFDYFTEYDEVALQAISSGRVMFVEVFERPPDGAFQINLAWQTPTGEVISYSLEPSAGPADAAKIAGQKVLAEKMMKSMTVQSGDSVSQGQFLGYLYGQDEWAHVHMTLKANNRGAEQWLCPADFMSGIDESDLLAKSKVWAERLYKGSKKPQLCNY